MSSESDPDSGTASGPRLSGCVYLPDGKPASGALVALSTDLGSPDIAASTDAEGYFHLPIRALANGTVTATMGSLRASAPIQSDEQPVVLHLKELSHE
jgi:hypothetical protein